MVCPTCLMIRAFLEQQGVAYETAATVGDALGKPLERKVKRKVSAYHRRLGIILRRLKKRHTLKNGKWRKGWTQKRLMKAAHKEAKR